MTELECQRCGREWDYGGSRHYATCPNCKTSVKAGELAAEDSADEKTVTNPMVDEEQTVPEALASLFDTVQVLWEEQNRLEERITQLEEDDTGEEIETEQLAELYEAVGSMVEQMDGTVEFEHAPGDGGAPSPGDIYDPTEDME